MKWLYRGIKINQVNILTTPVLSSTLQIFIPQLDLEVKCLSSKFNMNSLWAWLTNLILTLFLENLFGLNNFLQQFLQNHPNTYIPRKYLHHIYYPLNHLKQTDCRAIIPTHNLLNSALLKHTHSSSSYLLKDPC